MHSVTIGTCGWSYKDWVGHFYPPKTPPADFLSLYAEKFSIVEVDSTFYRLPAKSMVEGWRERTPPGFRFSLKVPQVITHEKVLVGCEEETKEFLAAVQLLGDKLLCVVLQFGYFNRKAFASEAAFVERLEPYLARWPVETPLAVEIRNKTWMNEAFLDVLRKHNAMCVLPDQAWMTSPLEVVQQFDAVTGPLGYVRLLGDRKAVDDLTPTLDHIVIDRSEQLERTAQAIRLLSKRVPVLAFVNNHYAGYAPETSRQLASSLQGHE